MIQNQDFSVNMNKVEKIEMEKELENKRQVILNSAYFNEYLKNRMDFLADIATSRIPSIENPVLFYSELIKGINKNKILLNRISGIDSNVKFTFQVLKYGKKVNLANDFYVSIPNDVLGCQAFYIIIENIIRNICKHSKKNMLFFIITIKISEPKDYDNYYKIDVYPKFYTKFDDSKSGIDKFCDLEESLDELITEALAKSRNETINISILRDDVLRDNSLGTIEMDICSAYLRKRDVVEVDFDCNDITKDFKNIDGTPNFLYAYSEKICEGKKKQYSLGYTFHLRKPRLILIIDSKNKLKLEDKTKEELNKNGVWILKQNLNLTDKCNYIEKNIYPHDILVYLDNNLEEFIKDNTSGLPIRIIKENDFDTTLMPKTNENRQFELFFWNVYITQKKFGIEFEADSAVNWENINTTKKSVFVDKDHNKNYEDHKNSYYELKCSHHRVNGLFPEEENNSYSSQLLRFKYMENVNTKIIVIDERIQGNILTKEKYKAGYLKDKFIGLQYANVVDLYHYFLKQDLIIPNYDEADLNVSNFGNLSEETSIATKINSFINNDSNQNADFIIIHLGILEKMLKNSADKSHQKINELISKLSIDKSKIVITSGRGKPNNLPPDIKFIPLSSIQNAIESQFDKFLLTQLLYNARKFKQ